LQAFYQITLPLAVPGLIAVSVFTFTAAWNELLFGLIFITKQSLYTVPVAISYLITGDVFRFGLIMAGSVAAAVPVMILYYAVQRFVVQGLTAGAVKG
jgi:multiple sugar transport system permease protein